MTSFLKCENRQNVEFFFKVVCTYLYLAHACNSEPMFYMQSSFIIFIAESQRKMKFVTNTHNNNSMHYKRKMQLSCSRDDPHGSHKTIILKWNLKEKKS